MQEAGGAGGARQQGTLHGADHLGAGRVLGGQQYAQPLPTSSRSQVCSSGTGSASKLPWLPDWAMQACRTWGLNRREGMGAETRPASLSSGFSQMPYACLGRVRMQPIH